ncbi:MAG: serine/threonine protein kinase [Archangiaceae bacterium]|nr:serine/threonine protein kinase [Archangiaceae bacterium]
MVTTPGADALIGETLDGRFKIIEPIGSGGMGRVYKAVQAPLNRAVALKVLDYNYGPGRDPTFRQRFLVEAAMTAKLNHPNTITVIDYGCTESGIFYIAMEYLEGRTLDQHIAKSGPLPWRRALTIAQQVARSLREAHNLGVVHRDLKPPNIMLLDSGDDGDVVKVLDFGLVKSFVAGHELEGRALTQQGMLMGSPPYMAPEQGENNVADPRSDIYSLGIIMYEMLTGAPPFKGNNAMQVILEHVNKPVPPLKTPARVELPPQQLLALVMKCLAKSPMDRFQSMEEVLAAMQEVASPGRHVTPVLGTRAPSRPVMAPVKVAAPAERAKWLTPLLFVVATALGSVATVALLKRSGPAVVQQVPVKADPVVVAAPVAPVMPVVPAKVTFHVDSEPQGAAVKMGADVLGVTPLDFTVPAGDEGSASVELTLSLKGYLPMTVTTGGSGPRIEVLQKLQVDRALVPLVSKPTGKKKGEPRRAESGKKAK